MVEIRRRQDVATAVSRAKTAYERGKLDNYKPLTASGSEQVKSTCMTSWGPAMRR